MSGRLCCSVPQEYASCRVRMPESVEVDGKELLEFGGGGGSGVASGKLDSG